MWSVVTLGVLLLYFNISVRLKVGLPRSVHSDLSAKCTGILSPDHIEHIADGVVNSYKFNSSEPPSLYVLLGGPGSGKGIAYSALHRSTSNSSNKSTPFLLHGLDEYLLFHPDYDRLFQNRLFVYRTAADSCYPSILPLARRVRDLALAQRISLVYEETGKDLIRLQDRVLAPFVNAGYKIIGILVETDPDVAVLRARQRFLSSGRYASEKYTRSSFPDSKSIKQLFVSTNHMLIICSNDCRHRRGSALAKAFMENCFVCDGAL